MRALPKRDRIHRCRSDLRRLRREGMRSEGTTARAAATIGHILFGMAWLAGDVGLRRPNELAANPFLLVTIAKFRLVAASLPMA